MDDRVFGSRNFFYADIYEDGRISTTWCWCYPDDGRQLMWHSRYAPDFADDAGCEFELMFDGESPIDDGWDCECIRQRSFDEREPLTYFGSYNRTRELDGISRPGRWLLAYSCWDDDGAIIESGTGDPDEDFGDMSEDLKDVAASFLDRVRLF